MMYAIEQIFIVANSRILKNNLNIWPHSFSLSLSLSLSLLLLFIEMMQTRSSSSWEFIDIEL